MRSRNGPQPDPGSAAPGSGAHPNRPANRLNGRQRGTDGGVAGRGTGQSTPTTGSPTPPRSPACAIQSHWRHATGRCAGGSPPRTPPPGDDPPDARLRGEKDRRPGRAKDSMKHTAERIKPQRAPNGAAGRRSPPSHPAIQPLPYQPLEQPPPPQKTTPQKQPHKTYSWQPCPGPRTKSA